MDINYVWTKLFKRICGNEYSKGKGNIPDFPIHQICLDDVQKYLAKYEVLVT